MIRLLSVAAIAGVLPGAIFACGGRAGTPSAPAEAQPMAPRPDPTTPAMVPNQPPDVMKADAGAPGVTPPAALLETLSRESEPAVADRAMVRAASGEMFGMMPTAEPEPSGPGLASAKAIPEPSGPTIDPQPVDPPTGPDPQPSGIPPKDAGLIDDAGNANLPPIPDAKPNDGGIQPSNAQ